MRTKDGNITTCIAVSERFIKARPPFPSPLDFNIIHADKYATPSFRYSSPTLKEERFFLSALVNSWLPYPPPPCNKIVH